MDDSTTIYIAPVAQRAEFLQYAGTILGVIIGIIIAIIVVYTITQTANTMRIDKRIRDFKIDKVKSYEETREEIDLTEHQDHVEQTISKIFPGLKTTKKALKQAGNMMSIRVYALGILFTAFACASFIHIPYLPAVAAPFFWLFILHISASKIIIPKIIRARQVNMIKQIPGMMDYIIRAVIVSKGLEDAICDASVELPAPLSQELKLVPKLLAMGMGLGEALTITAMEIDTPEFDFFTSACIAKIDSGGELIEILRSISVSIRGRIALYDEINSMTQEGKMSAYFLACLPIGLLIYIKLSHPEYVEPLFTTLLGNGLLALAILMVVVGTWVSVKIATVKP